MISCATPQPWGILLEQHCSVLKSKCSHCLSSKIRQLSRWIKHGRFGFFSSGKLAALRDSCAGQWQNRQPTVPGPGTHYVLGTPQLSSLVPSTKQQLGRVPLGESAHTSIKHSGPSPYKQPRWSLTWLEVRVAWKSQLAMTRWHWKVIYFVHRKHYEQKKIKMGISS